jgi:four helix bundle protein
MPKCTNFRDLAVWRKGMDLAVDVYTLTEGFPRREMFGLVNQIRRAVSSVPGNIAEGAARQGPAEFKHHLSIARGSLAEVGTFLELSSRLGHAPAEDIQEILIRIDEIERMVHGLRNSLSHGPGKSGVG